MGGNGKHGWKISFHKSSPSKSRSKDPPKEFICPISHSLMFDPVVVSSGQTYERASVQVCLDLGFTPPLPDGSLPDFSTLITNLALKTTILNWCDTVGVQHPSAPDYSSLQIAVRTEMAAFRSNLRDSEKDLLRGLPEKPPARLTHAQTELNPRANHFYSSSSDESVIANVPGTPLLSFTTRPSCYSISSSASTSAEIVSDESLNPNSSSSYEAAEILLKLTSFDVFDQEQGLITLRKITRTNEEARVSLCTSPLIAALRSGLISKYTDVQTNAAAATVNLSLENVNKVKIVRSGIVPPLIDLLKGGLPESQEHAAGALFSLALDEDNRTAIGVLGALQPLLHALRSESERTRQDSASALYNLSLSQSNRVKLIKLGAVSTLLALLKCGDLAGRVLLVLCSLATCAEGKSAMLHFNAVECLVGMLRKGGELDSESTRENCVAALYSLSRGSLRFKVLAREARAAEVLREVEEKGSDRAREKAKRMLMMLRGRDEEDWEGVLEGGPSRNGCRLVRGVYGPTSTEF